MSQSGAPVIGALAISHDKEDLLSRLFEAMGCDTLEEAVMQAELDTRESLKAAEAIRQCAGMPENVWPSPHERRFFIALKEHLSATLHIPVGWKLVPIEPNSLMVSCGYLEQDDQISHWELYTKELWRRMLDAAPSYVNSPSTKDDK